MNHLFNILTNHIVHTNTGELETVTLPKNDGGKLLFIKPQRCYMSGGNTPYVWTGRCDIQHHVVLGDAAYNDWVENTYDVEVPKGYLFIGEGGVRTTPTPQFKAQEYKYIRASESEHDHHVEGIYPPLSAYADDDPIFYFIKNTEENRAYMLELVNGIEISQVVFEKSLKNPPESTAWKSTQAMTAFIQEAIDTDMFIKVDHIDEHIDPKQCQVLYSFKYNKAWIQCPTSGESGFILSQAMFVVRANKTTFKVNDYYGVYDKECMAWKFGCAYVDKVTISDAVHFLSKHAGSGSRKAINSIMIGEGKFELKQLQEMKDKQATGR